MWSFLILFNSFLLFFVCYSRNRADKSTKPIYTFLLIPVLSFLIIQLYFLYNDLKLSLFKKDSSNFIVNDFVAK